MSRLNSLMFAASLAYASFFLHRQRIRHTSCTEGSDTSIDCQDKVNDPAFAAPSRQAYQKLKNHPSFSRPTYRGPTAPPHPVPSEPIEIDSTMILKKPEVGELDGRQLPRELENCVLHPRGEDKVFTLRRIDRRVSSAAVSSRTESLWELTSARTLRESCNWGDRRVSLRSDKKMKRRTG